MQEKNNRKKRGQKTNLPQQPQPKSQRKATVIITPDAEKKVDIQTGNVADLEMYMYLRDMTKHFATTLCKEAQEVVGDSPEEQVKYLDWRIAQSGLNG